MQPAVRAPSNLLAGSFGEMGEGSIRYTNVGTFLLVRIMEWDNGGLRDGTEPSQESQAAWKSRKG